MPRVALRSPNEGSLAAAATVAQPCCGPTPQADRTRCEPTGLKEPGNRSFEGANTGTPVETSLKIQKLKSFRKLSLVTDGAKLRRRYTLQE
jgi:hypothetical protein